MKPFGILLIIIGILCMAAPAISSLIGEKKPDILTALEVADKQGQSITLYPLLGIVSFAAGAALVTASIITRRK